MTELTKPIRRRTRESFAHYRKRIVVTLEPGDLITQINNRQVGSPNDVDSTLAGMHPGQRVQIQYERGPFTDIAQVTLAPRPKGSP